MRAIISALFTTELTCIPHIIESYAGRYYNNAVCNAATWVFVLWCILHAMFDRFLNGLLRKMKCKCFLRERLKRYLWYLGFYSAVLVYATAILYRNNVSVFNFKVNPQEYNNVSGESVIGLVFLFTFFIQSAFWEGLNYSDGFAVVYYSSLAFFLLFTHYLKCLEMGFIVVGIASFSQVIVNLTKGINVLVYTVGENKLYVFLEYVLLAATALSVIIGYLVAIPLAIFFPLFTKLFTEFPASTLPFMCLGLLTAFITSAAYTSPLYQLCEHCFYHTTLEEVCDIFECSLHPLRDDDTYNLCIMLQEAKKREFQRMPSNKNKLIQTLKCVLAVKKKIQQKRAQNDSDKESESATSDQDDASSKLSNPPNSENNDQISSDNNNSDTKDMDDPPSTNQVDEDSPEVENSHPLIEDDHVEPEVAVAEQKCAFIDATGNNNNDSSLSSDNALIEDAQQPK